MLGIPRHFAAPDSVELLPGFWRDHVERNRTVGIPRLYERLEAHGVVDNFRRLAGRHEGPRRGLWFTDSDLYKWMEAAAWSRDDALDEVVSVVLGAQSDDGYLNTNFDIDHRFADLSWSHELYCAGHFIQAAIARSRAQGRDDLLDGACRFADLIADEWAPGGRDDRDHHPVIEMALVELYRATGTARYLDLAARLCDLVPWESWSRLSGHAVCALYFASGLTDVAIEMDEVPRAEAQAAPARGVTAHLTVRSPAK